MAEEARRAASAASLSPDVYIKCKLFARAHKLLTITILARNLHTEWFFKNDRDEKHDLYVRQLCSDRVHLEDNIFGVTSLFRAKAGQVCGAASRQQLQR